MKDKINNVLLSFLFGFLGGVIGSVIVVIILKFINSKMIQITDNKFKALLDWPFLLFFILLLIVIIFQKEIKSRLTKIIKIKWGDTEIHIDDIGEVIDKEISSNLDNLELEKEDKESNDAIQKIKDIFKIDKNSLALIIYHLGNSKYKWRNLKTLIKRTGLSLEDIERLVRLNPELIIRGNSKEGNIIYRLNDNMKYLFDESIK